jgi:hypothetical protein
MPQDNQLSPLFGHMQDTPPGDTTPAPQEVSDKTNTILGSTVPEPAPVSESLFWAAAPVPEHPSPTPEVIPEVTPVTPSAISLPEVSLPEISTPPAQVPIPEVTSPEEDLDRDIPLHIITPPAVPETANTIPSEQVEQTDTGTWEADKTPTPDPRLVQYLQADRVYQDMIRVESSEKIRLQLAIRYTLLMFAIFLVFAWIVSNRVIMLGFSEFVWLARIRDLLFAVMSGLFGLTLWFGSVTWTHNRILISVIRTLAVLFFGAVVVALYIL